MLLAPANTVLVLAKLLNFVHRTTLSAGKDLKTILILYDTPSAELTSDILCSFRLQSLDVSWSTINLDAHLRTNDFQHGRTLGRTLILAILQTRLEYGFYDIIPTIKINRINIILIYPFEISDDEFYAEFKQICNQLSIILVNFVGNNIAVIFRSVLFDRLLFLNEHQFENDIQNLFYRPFYNMQSQPFDVIVIPEPPVTFNTISTHSGGHQAENGNGVAGADLYLTQLIAECLNGKAKFLTYTVKGNEGLEGLQPEYIDFLKNKIQLPLKAPTLPPIKNVEFVSDEIQLMR